MLNIVTAPRKKANLLGSLSKLTTGTVPIKRNVLFLLLFFPFNSKNDYILKSKQYATVYLFVK